MIKFKVSELINYIKEITAGDYVLANLSVEGEISNLNLHSSGNAYFSLKDEYARLNCIFYNYRQHDKMKISKDGDLVSITGRTTIVEQDGFIRFIAEDIEKVGLGQLYDRFIKTRDELDALGYFSPEHKKLLPEFPKNIGVITSSDGAAIKDILATLKRRNPYVNLYLYPAVVQGIYSADSLIKGLEYFNDSDMDLVIIGRGGGSYEDLDSFNSKELALKIFNFNIPIISAVGHERDFVISDYVSDLRAATPTAAAELAVRSHSELMYELKNLLSHSKDLLENKLLTYNNKLEILNKRIQSISYEKQIDNKVKDLRQKLEKLNLIVDHTIEINSEKLNTVFRKISTEKIQRKISELDNQVRLLNEKSYRLIDYKLLREERKLLELKSKLEKLDIKSMLKQGYSIVLDEEDSLVKSIKQIEENEKISILVNDGIIDAKVIRVR